MKKLLYSILALVLVLFVGIYCVLFTGFGNNFVKNIAEKKLNENSNIAIKIEEFELGISKINLKVLVNAMLEAKVNGDFSLLSQSLDVKYELNGKNLELLKITDPLNIAGNIKGNFSDFNIDGKGVIFTSPLTLDANVKDYFPTKLNLDANNLDVEKLSKIAGVDYASGFMNLNANVNEFDKDKLDAKALVSIYSELKLKPSITKDFGIDISRFGKVIIDSKNTYKANEITPNLQIKSNILNLTSNFEPINLTNQVVKGQVITNLSELAFINPTLNSNLKITSDILYKDKVANINSVLSGKNINTKLTKVTINQENTTISTDLRANAELIRLQGGELINLVANAKLGKSGLENADIKGLLLGANSNITLGKNDLNASIKGLKSLALLGLLNQDKMLDADINIDAKLSDLKNLVGNANLEINGKTVPSYFKKAYDLDVNSKVNANANIKLSGAENITLDAKLITDLVDSFNANGTYKKGVVNANYNASANLANFNKMLNKNMSGNIAVQGDLVFDKILNLTLNSNEFFGGKLNAKLNGDKFNANLSNVALENLSKSFDLLDVYKANVNGNLDYDLKQASGKLTANLGKGHLKYHKTIKLINTILNTDVTKVVFDKGDVLVNINKNLIDYNANISATNAKIAVSNGTYNTLSKVINAPILVSFNNNEVKGKIAGIDEDVKFIPDAKNTVENAVKVLDKLTGKNNSEKLNETLKPAENLLKGLFKR
ncbi:hypothetical protein AVANS14531_03090 [Campylobacter sp. Cr9]|uniref:hypothetical protein n=1 Tax=Campylobacter sp. Cr9 TaxID=2735728 RepID=UPI003014428B|nr:hypothetical protein [Campylobacter sp. Cr9]